MHGVHADHACCTGDLMKSLTLLLYKDAEATLEVRWLCTCKQATPHQRLSTLLQVSWPCVS